MTPEQFVQRLFNHIGAPQHATDLKAFKEDYVAALAGSDPDLLQEACDRLLRARTFRAWPMVGECVQAVNDAAVRRNNSRRSASLRSTPPPEENHATAESRARVAELVRNSIARRNRIGPTYAEPELPRVDRQAWTERLASSETARRLSIPREG